VRIVFTLGGTDAGKSGLGSYVNAVLPELRVITDKEGVELVALGSASELESYAAALVGIQTLTAPRWAASPGPSALWYLAAAGRAAKLTAEDVILYSAANRRFGAFNGGPSVAVVHDLAQLHVPGKYDALRMAYVRYGLWSLLRRASRLVAISEATRTDLVDALGVERDLVDVVPNGVDATRFAPRAPDDPAVLEVRRALGLASPYLLYPARLELPAKNHLRLLRAFARSRASTSHQLVLVGADWGARAAISDAITTHGLGAHVKLCGYVDDNAIAPLVAGADGVVMVGLCEGFGLPALEALAAGRPVCASNTGALPEVVGDLGALCDPFSVDSIADALNRVAFDDEYRAQCARRGPELARTRTWARTAEGLYQSCRRAVVSRRSSPPQEAAAE
jgi:glycosyltransferase involved in cell wall biosynthesis